MRFCVGEMDRRYDPLMDFSFEPVERLVALILEYRPSHSRSLCFYMLQRVLAHQVHVPRLRFARMATHMSHITPNGHSATSSKGLSLGKLPKSNVFTSNLPPDPAYPTPADSHKTPRDDLGPRLVKGALYTFIRPETVEEPELLGVSPRAMRDIGIEESDESRREFKDVVAGNKIISWDESSGEGIYPWAQCYGGW